MVALRVPDPPPALYAEAQRLYLETNTSTTDIAKLIGMLPRTFRSRRQTWGWPLRRVRRAPASDAAQAAAGATTPNIAPPLRAGLAAQALRLERLVARRIDHLEAEAAAGRDRDPDNTDRRLVQLERLLAQLGKRRGQDGEPDESSPPARSVAELRDELLRHLENVRKRARPRKLPREAEPG